MKRIHLTTSLLFVMILSVYAQEVRYEIKSAIIKKETILMGQKVESIWYMDEYGKKESSEMTAKVGGIANIEKQIRTIVEADSYINVDLEMKTAMRAQIPMARINYLNLTPEIREEYKVKELEVEDIAGKPSQKLSIEITQMGQVVQGTVWVWKGIPLKNELGANGMVLQIENSLDIQENVPVPAEKFEVPEGITIQ